MSPRGTKQDVVVVEQLANWEKVAKIVRDTSLAVLMAALLGMVLWLGFGHMARLFDSIDRKLSQGLELDKKRVALLEATYQQQQRNHEAMIAILARLDK